jgi:pyruvate/2-oxoglutarate dehydrogenase complex dihydrolipoamide acyltransferase (E2) component
MKVRFLKQGVFSKFFEGKAFAATYAEGDEVDYPAWYANGLIESGFAERVIDEPKSEPQTIEFLGQEIEIEEAAGPEIVEVVNATDAALKLAKEKGINLNGVFGSGKGGKITMGDVKKLANE